MSAPTNPAENEEAEEPQNDPAGQILTPMNPNKPTGPDTESPSHPTEGRPDVPSE
ncbi:MAG: hypothetical protein QOJ00_539 [Actinomycetota bacterium]